MNIKLEYVSVNELVPYDKNTRLHEDYDVSQIAKSIEKYGFNDPIGVWKGNVIIEGHGRLEAAKTLGLKEVPIIRLDHLTDKERREYAIMHNKTAELSKWDFDALGKELLDIDFYEQILNEEYDKYIKQYSAAPLFPGVIIRRHIILAYVAKIKKLTILILSLRS